MQLKNTIKPSKNRIIKLEKYLGRQSVIFLSCPPTFLYRTWNPGPMPSEDPTTDLSQTRRQRFSTPFVTVPVEDLRTFLPALSVGKGAQTCQNVTLGRRQVCRCGSKQDGGSWQSSNWQLNARASVLGAILGRGSWESVLKGSITSSPSWDICW